MPCWRRRSTNWPAVSYNPNTKLFYFRVSDSCGIFTSHEDPLGVSGNRWFGRGTPSDPQKAQQALAALQANYTGGNFIRAMNPFKGKKVWDYPAPPGRSGVLSTAGGLVFIGGGGGLMAVDAKAGTAALARQSRPDHAVDADDVHGWRHAVRRSARRRRRRGIYAALIRD